MPELDIGEVSRRSGLPASTLRFYEQKKLIASLGRAAGFSLDEIAPVFATGARPRIDRRVLAAKAAELERRIRRLGAIRDGLRHASVCPAPSHMECPTFKRLLRAALARQPVRRRKP